MSPLSALRRALRTASDGSAVVGILGTPGSRPYGLADVALGTSLSGAAEGVAADADADVAAVVLGCDALGDSSAKESAAFVVALAGVVVHNARVADFERGPGASGVDALMEAVAGSLELRATGRAAVLPKERLLLVAVRDYEEEDIEKADLQAAIMEMLCAGYAGIKGLPAAYAATELEDVFSVQFTFVKSEVLCQGDFESAAAAFGRVVGDAGRNGFADAGMTPARVEENAIKVWSAIDPESGAAEGLAGSGGKDLPGERELAATFACDEIMNSVQDRYAATTRQWRATVESGRIIRDFGEESEKLITATLEKYSSDASSYRTTKAFARKKDEMRALCLADCYTLYAKQILKLREVAYQVFRGNLARIRINDRVEKNVNMVVKNAETYFVEKAESLRCDLSNWRYDNERHELVNHMREDATERLQLARLQGNYVPPIRAPVAVAFHTLLTSPFGAGDAASAQPATSSTEQPQFKADKDKGLKADKMVARPQQNGPIVTLRGSDLWEPIDEKELIKNFEAVLTPIEK